VWGCLCVLLAGASVGTSAVAQTAQQLARQRAQYDAVAAKSIIELQPFRVETRAKLPGTGKPLRLISVNPAANSWFLLMIGKDGTRRQKSYHIENRDPTGQTLSLETRNGPVLVIGGRAGQVRCSPWAGAPSALARARASGLPFAPLCDGRIYLRNKVSGAQTSLERTTNFLRKHVWKGEQVVRFVRDNFYKDAFLETSAQISAGKLVEFSGAPAPANLKYPAQKRPVITALHGLGLTGTKPRQMTVGNWYPLSGVPGVFASAIQPKAISKSVLKGPGRTNPLDSVERNATEYLVAFDLSQFELGYAVGTTHPGLGWSPRPPASVRPRGLPGPDGVKSAAPLVMLGMVSPGDADRAVATFTAGFKRSHGAFKYGKYATLNMGSHYGFIEQGAILSKLQPRLSTIYVLDDGTIGMKTWTRADNAMLRHIRFARQNGVPLLERDPASGRGVPGALVPFWGPGNWSGSADMHLRTLRGGACITAAKGRKFLVYGYFSSATPSAMARTFQAYGCSYAMLLDMNALEHTYLAVYARRGGSVHVEHLVPGMSVIDKKARDGSVIPRFVGFPDNRDLFYLLRRKD